MKFAQDTARSLPHSESLERRLIACSLLDAESYATVCAELDPAPDPFVAGASRRVLENTEW